MARVSKALRLQALEYFYADNWLDLEAVMESIRAKSPVAADKLRDEMAAMIQEQSMLEEINDVFGEGNIL